MGLSFGAGHQPARLQQVAFGALRALCARGGSGALEEDEAWKGEKLQGRCSFFLFVLCIFFWFQGGFGEIAGWVCVFDLKKFPEKEVLAGFQGVGRWFLWHLWKNVWPVFSTWDVSPRPSRKDRACQECNQRIVWSGCTRTTQMWVAWLSSRMKLLVMIKLYYNCLMSKHGSSHSEEV